MPQVKFSLSPLGVSIAPKIIDFIKDNTDYMKTLSEGKVEDGAEAIAHAIVYGVSIALSSPLLKPAFACGIGPPPAPTVTPGGPIGLMILGVLTPIVTET